MKSLSFKLAALLLALALLLSGCGVMDLLSLLQEGTGQKLDLFLDLEVIEDMMQLRDFVTEQIGQGKYEFSFQYKGSEPFDPAVIAQMSGSCFVLSIQQGAAYHISLTRYPGDRIVEAYASGDTSALSAEECQALEKAVEMVAQAKENSENDWELELQLHDALARCITYSDAPIDYEKPEDQPRHVSVIGALLDGEANCQGYSDAFYTLASIAGFQVGRLSVVTSTDPHMVNTICLDGRWYVVDLTYDDGSDEVISYHLFNAGLDLIGQEYTWAKEVEQHPIAPESDEHSYLIRKELVFTDMEELADYIAADWAKQGNTVIHAMLSGEPDSEKLGDFLPDALDQWGKSYSYSIWHKSNGTDSFYTVVFKG